MTGLQLKEEQGYTIGRDISELWHYWRLIRMTERRIRKQALLLVREGIDTIDLIGALCESKVRI